LLRLQLAEQVIGTVAAAGTNDGPHVVPHEHLFQLTSAALDGSREVHILFQDRLKIERVIAEFAHRRTAFFEQILLNVAGGRDDADPVAGLERRRLGARSLESPLHGFSILTAKTGSRS